MTRRASVRQVRTTPAWRAAYMLADRCGKGLAGIEEAHHIAYFFGHEHTHHGADGVWWRRLEWRRVAARLEQLYHETLATHQAAERRALLSRGRRPLNVRREVW